MNIRRKVFSAVEDYDGEIRYYSTTDIAGEGMNEVDEVDALIQRAFSEGYEYAQREFAEEEAQEEKKGWSKGAKIAAATAAPILTAAAVYGGSKFRGNRAKKKVDESIKKATDIFTKGDVKGALAQAEETERLKAAAAGKGSIAKWVDDKASAGWGKVKGLFAKKATDGKPAEDSK